jgi:16S rRNA (uracil1498-N3)-methyltransferase
MNRFFVEKSDISGSSAALYGDDVKHISTVLRLGIGDEVMLCDGMGMDYHAKISSVSKTEVHFDILSASPALTEPRCKLTLFQGLPKAGKLESIIQKCVELGISDIVPVNMERSVVKLSKKDFNKKLDRYQRVALEASKQSRRGIIPRVHELIDTREINAEAFDALLLAYELESEHSLKDVLSSLSCDAERLGIIVGPEGGISDNEVSFFSSIGARSFSLGHRILRTETAGPAITSIIMYHMEGEA